MKRFFFTLALLLLCSMMLTGCGDNNETMLPPDDNTGEAVTELDSAEVWCSRDGLRIYGKLYRPKGNADALPAVILAHSHSLTHLAMRRYARQIAEDGFATYCFDFCGGSDESQSDGSTDDMTLFTETADLEAVLQQIAARDDIDASRVFLLGSSLGGVAAALTAESCAEQVAGLILFYPAFNISELVNRFAGMIPGMEDFFQTKFITTLKDYDPYAHIGTYSRDVLILQGSADILVPVSSSEKAAALYPHATLQVI
ncbi:MAG: alpha/beta hydrolase, partial [Alloprevotella sp.]|nr:alpha/beta hydrolase [Alloprevotella sp.]